MPTRIGGGPQVSPTTAHTTNHGVRRRCRRTISCPIIANSSSSSSVSPPSAHSAAVEQWAHSWIRISSRPSERPPSSERYRCVYYNLTSNIYKSSFDCVGEYIYIYITYKWSRLNNIIVYIYVQCGAGPANHLLWPARPRHNRHLSWLGAARPLQNRALRTAGGKRSALLVKVDFIIFFLFFLIKCNVNLFGFFFTSSTGEFATCWYVLLSGAVFINGSMFLPGSRWVMMLFYNTRQYPIYIF